MTANGMRGPWAVAAAAGCGFASFYSFYAAAPLLMVDSRPAAGVRVAVVMFVIVATSLLVPVFGRWTRARGRTLSAALVMIAVGYASLPLTGGWPVVLGVGFGVLIVVAAAWSRELVATRDVGRAMGVYGFGSSLGGVVGAPAGLLIAAQVGAGAAALSGAAFALLGLIPVATVSRGSQAVAGRAGDAGGAEPAPVGRRDAAAKPGGPATGGVFAALAAHLVAVIAYGAVLSSTASFGADATAPIVVIAAFVIQSAVAAGRLVSGASSDRWPPSRPALVGTVAFASGIALFAAGDATAVTLIACALVGSGSGAIQTATLTYLMRHAERPGTAERMSAAWNVVFDAGIGVGAIVAADVSSP